MNGCFTVQDSIFINVIDSISPFGIISSTDTICMGDSLLLELPSGIYNSIVWSNGLTDTSIYIYVPGDYIVEVSNECFFQISDTLTIAYGNCITGIPIDHSEEDIHFFPNPNNGNFIISVNDNKLKYMEIMNQLGQIVYKTGLNESNNNITLPFQIPSGFYFLRVLGKDNNIIYFNKLVIGR
jgi:hypothetical protein